MDERDDAALWADLKEFQASMAIEGYVLSEEQLIEAYERAQLSDSPRNIMKSLRQRAETTGEDFDELVDKYLDWQDAQDSQNK